MVLLKNNHLLPLKDNLQSLGIIGPNAKHAQIIGGGSAHLQAYHESHPLEAFKNKIGSKVDIEYSKGCHTYKYLPAFKKDLIESGSNKNNQFLIEYFNAANGEKKLISQEYALKSKFWALEGFAKDIIAKEERPDIFVKFSCNFLPDISGDHEFEIFAIGKSKLFIDGKELIDNWTNPIYIGCKTPDKINLFNEALNIAKDVDQVVMIVGTNSDWETEGNDRTDFNLPSDQNKLIDAVLNVNPNTIIVLNTGSPIKMPWIKKASSIIQTWYAGQEFGNALVDIITGDVNPSGKLPTTFPINIEDTPAFKSYPGQDLQMNYEEKNLVGYKWYDKKSISTLYPFGHGLSYTKFKYSKLVISNIGENKISCRFILKNIGPVSGSEISQCYIGYQCEDKSEPIKKLQEFDKSFLNSQEAKEIEIILSPNNFRAWDIIKKEWVIRKGSYKVYIGSSSEDIHLSEHIKL